MVTQATKDRIEAVLPEQYRIRVETDSGPKTGKFDLNRYVDADISDADYPLVVLTFDPEMVPREQQPLSGSFGTRSPSSGKRLAGRQRGRRVYDQLQVSVATKGYHDPTGTMAKDRAAVLAREMYDFTTYDLEGKLTGEHGRNTQSVSIPDQHIGAVRDTSDMIGDTEVQRRTWQLRLRYVTTRLEAVETATADEVGVRAKRDGQSDPAQFDADPADE